MTLLHHVIAQDVGRALNPALVSGQLVGGVTQGFGWALFEQLAYDEEGQLRTGSFVEYAMPTIDTVPPIDAEIVEVPAPDGPFGAKGVGEPPVVRRPRRGGQRHRRGHGAADARPADDAAARVGGAERGRLEPAAAARALLGPLACGGRVLSPDTASDSAGSV